MNMRIIRLLEIAFIGGIGGLMSWGFLQLFLYAQFELGPLPLFDLFVYEGTVVGIGLGIFIKSQKVVFSEHYFALRTSIPLGAFLGGISGLLGFLIGQSLLATPLDIPFSWIRIISWGLLGLWLGVFNNLTMTISMQGAFQIVGAVFGGLAGGFFLEAIQLLQVGFIGHLAGLIVLGIVLLLSMVFIEIYSVKGYLRILTGKREGKIFLLDKNLLSLGYQGHNDIILRGYIEVCGTHAHIIRENSHCQIVNVCSGGQLSVNFRFVDQQSMKNGDIIKLGTALLQYCKVT